MQQCSVVVFNHGWNAEAILPGDEADLVEKLIYWCLLQF